ncbi:hypothetical protein B0H63DRAFT_36264 [Podospora didyma]|uniref:Proteophosphoglycan ppg4 n=1 Tax=Podospora didyma TaxID=330526 RepID=A0AAE0P6D8_9PEZI|nr:hypothetical protein B0H63DRAFT_36264 [Podospora didyma]
MGNAQSSIEAPPRQSHRLSKPKTGNHATAGLLSPNGFSNTSRHFSSARLSTLLPPLPSQSPDLSSVSTPTTSTPEASTSLEQRSPIERSTSVAVPAQKKESLDWKRSLFRSKSSQGTSDPKRRNSIVESASRVADKLGRANSMTYESAVSYYGQPAPENWPGPPRTRSSWNYNPTSYEAKRLLNLEEEPALEHATTMSENRMTVVTESTWKSSNPANPESAPISRVNSDMSLYVPVRRRSVIQKPGIATRSNSMQNSPALSRSNFRYSHPPTPNLSRQQSFESYRGGVISMPPRMPESDQFPRVVTPCEDEYQSIGAFKLGSLRITNGAASPEIEKTRRRVQMGQRDPDALGDGYFAGAQPGNSDDTNGAAPSDVLPPTVEAPQPRAVQLSPIPTSFLSLEEVASAVSGPPMSEDLDSTVIDAPPQFLAEIDFSPFSFHGSQPGSPQLLTTSKTTALEDDLFDDEAQPEYSSVEVLDVRLDPSAKSPHGQVSTNVDKTFGRSDSGFLSTSSPSLDVIHKPLTKADSGYSSNVSLRSFQLKAQLSEGDLASSLEKQPSQSSQKSLTVPSEDRSLPRQSEESYPMPPQREAPPPPVPPKDLPQPLSPIKVLANVIPKKSRTTSVRLPESSFSTANISKTARHIPSPISLPYIDTRLKSPEPTPRTPASARSVKSDNSASALSIGSGPHKPGKLQRLLSSARRSAAGPLTVHATHVVEKTGIPSIPRDVEHKLHEHSGQFPMTTKRLALKPRSSKDTLKTIFSVGSMDVSVEAVNAIPMVPRVAEADDEDAAETKEPLWRQTLHSVPTSIAHVASHVIPRKPIARKPVPVRHESLKEKGQRLEKSATTRPNLPNVARPTSNTVQPLHHITRTMSLTMGAEQNWEMRLQALGSNVVYSTPDLPSSSLPSPFLARAVAMEKKARMSPPVSMMNRKPMSLRVPPPLRSQSSTASLSRKGSRESIQSYPSAQRLTRTASRDSIHSYPSHQEDHTASNIPNPATSPPPMDPRRIMSFRHSQTAQPSLHRAPSWDVQTDHDITRRSSQSSLNGVSRHNSLSSVPGQDGPGIQRPSSAQNWQVRTNQPPLRHRASYDGYNHQQHRLQQGNAPSMSNGYTAPSKPTLDPWINKQLAAPTGHRAQDGPYPPHVPRNHRRNHSVGSRNGHSTNPPYRILHSYNSPAYRGVPIWG